MLSNKIFIEKILVLKIIKSPVKFPLFIVLKEILRKFSVISIKKFWKTVNFLESYFIIESKGN